MDNKEVINTLSEIHEMMARSSKFLSLSGLSCALVGLFALCASFMAHYIIQNPQWYHYEKVTMLTTLALILLVVSLLTIFLFSKKKADKNHLSFKLDKTVRMMLWNFALPLLVGGFLCMALIYQGHYGLTSSFMLIFYGLALINLSNFTFSSIKYLGYMQLILGICDFCAMNYSLLFWSLGFGVCHIVYGLVFYLKFERKA